MKYIRVLGKALFYFSLFLFLASFCFLDNDILDLDKKLSYTLYDRENNLIAYSKNKDDNYYFKTTKDEVNPQFLNILIASEDKRFNYHLGVDFIAIARSFLINLKHGKVVSGGSTIAMQSAKLLLNHKRTYLAKIKEMLLATALTLYYGKDRVLSLYLTLSPYGSSINSTKAASYFLFNKSPLNLTLSESALLVAIPKHPNKISIIYKENKDRAFIYKNKVLKSAFLNGIISQKAYKSSIKESVTSYDCKHNFKKCLYPQKSYYLGQYVFAHTKSKDNYSYIDKRIQDTLLHVSLDFKENYDSSINLGLVAIDNSKNELVGYIGGIHNEIFTNDATRSLRSTGSILKPFIYALAFDKNIILPHSIIEDNKITINTWSPRNFDKQYRGNVRAKYALINSLNVPAVELLAKLQAKNLIFNLNHGYNFLRCKDDSLTTALGSCSSSLLSISSLYTIFSNQGIYEATKIFNTKKDNSYSVFYNTKYKYLKYKFVDKDSSNAILHILKETARPSGFSSFNKVSYKTGTSSNFNDALAIGFKDNITIGVRAIKNVKNNINITGYTVAAPILFKAFDEINTKEETRDISSTLLQKKYKNNLDRFYLNDERYFTKEHKDKLKIVFPLDKSLIIANDNCIFLEYSGGSTIKKLYVNDILQSRTNVFCIEQEGQYNISIVDDNLDNDSIEVFIKK